MLSQQDQRVLADIESRLSASDPNLAHRLRGHGTLRNDAYTRAALIWLVVGAILLTTAFLVHSADLAFLGVGVVLADVGSWIATRVGHEMRERRDGWTYPRARRFRR